MTLEEIKKWRLECIREDHGLPIIGMIDWLITELDKSKKLQTAQAFCIALQNQINDPHIEYLTKIVNETRKAYKEAHEPQKVS